MKMQASSASASDLYSMIKAICCMMLAACACSAPAQTKGKEACCTGRSGAKAKDACCATASKAKTTAALSCTLTTEELRLRKETVLASLKKQVVERKELDNGYRYTFPGTDRMVDELAEFIKTERSCCAFFSFGLTVAGDKSTATLELTGPEGAKEMIEKELEL